MSETNESIPADESVAATERESTIPDDARLAQLAWTSRADG